MNFRWAQRVACEERGSGTVEFVTIFPFFMIIVLLIMEVTLALFWWKAAEKATYLAARYAVTSSAIVTGLASSNVLNTGNAANLYGMSCSAASSPCTSFGTLTCTGGTTGCDAAAFAKMLTTMQTIFGSIKASQVTVTYRYVGLGFAGGPTVPLITVTLHGVPLQTGIVSIIGNFIGGSGGALVALPDISATLTGEDLNSSGG